MKGTSITMAGLLGFYIFWVYLLPGRVDMEI